MKNIEILFSIVLGFLNTTQAQTTHAIVGAYHLRGGNHYLKADPTFVILAYATLITGKWELQENGLVYFYARLRK